MKDQAGRLQDINKENRAEKQTDVRQISFDDYVDTYKKEIQGSIDFIGQDVDFFIELKANLLLKIAGKYLGSTSGIKALDIGSGVGLVDRFLLKEIKDLHGIDVEQGVVEKARVNNPNVNYTVYNGMQIPFEDNTFDLAFAINVMHHVPPKQWQNFANEMHRVLKPGGIAAVFEHNPVNPLTRKVVRECEFDRDAVLLKHKKLKELFRDAELSVVQDGYIVFFPFKAGIFRSMESLIGWLPLGAQQYIAGRKISVEK